MLNASLLELAQGGVQFDLTSNGVQCAELDRVRSCLCHPMSLTPVAATSPLLRFLDDGEHITLVNIDRNETSHNVEHQSQLAVFSNAVVSRIVSADQASAADVYYFTAEKRLWHHLRRKNITATTSLDEALDLSLAHACNVFSEAHDAKHTPDVAQNIPALFKRDHDVAREGRRHR
jgi:hypothetical protein